MSLSQLKVERRTQQQREATDRGGAFQSIFDRLKEEQMGQSSQKLQLTEMDLLQRIAEIEEGVGPENGGLKQEISEIRRKLESQLQINANQIEILNKMVGNLRIILSANKQRIEELTYSEMKYQVEVNSMKRRVYQLEVKLRERIEEIEVKGEFEDVAFEHSRQVQYEKIISQKDNEIRIHKNRCFELEDKTLYQQAKIMKLTLELEENQQIFASVYPYVAALPVDGEWKIVRRLQKVVKDRDKTIAHLEKNREKCKENLSVEIRLVKSLNFELQSIRSICLKIQSLFSSGRSEIKSQFAFWQDKLSQNYAAILLKLDRKVKFVEEFIRAAEIIDQKAAKVMANMSVIKKQQIWREIASKLTDLLEGVINRVHFRNRRPCLETIHRLKDKENPAEKLFQANILFLQLTPLMKNHD